MWIEEQSNGKLRYVERYKEHYTGKYKRAYELIERDTPQGRKKAATALRLKIRKTGSYQTQKRKSYLWRGLSKLL
ncbi:prophage L54a integrase [Streptococcus pyogenes MGAS2111]|nr:prophage L54a integrase [Streptococcus pyogenes MGAS2111]